MESERTVTPGRLRRLREELVDEGSGIIEASTAPDVLLDELDYALHPPRHERHVPAFGAIVLPTQPVRHWGEPTGLTISVNPTVHRLDDEVRRYADGLASWVIRGVDGIDAVAVFDRAAGSERDLVVLAEATGAMIVQRGHDQSVRVVGSFGVARYDGVGWHVEPPFGAWLERARCGADGVASEVLDRLMRFAVHDLGANGIGALLILAPAGESGFEQRLAPPPALRIDRSSVLGPLRHVMRQIDGASVFDASGTLVHLGVRLVPSQSAEREIEPMGGTRHTSARRYSFDDPQAIVVTISESGPVTVFRGGEIVGRSGEEHRSE